MYNEIRAYVSRALIASSFSGISNKNKCIWPKATLMNRSFSLLIGGENSKNVGLPKGCEINGNGVSVVVERKYKGIQLVSKEYKYYATSNSGIDALKRLADEHFLFIYKIYQIIYCKELMIA